MSYAVGDQVRAVHTLTEPPSEELPAQHFCDAGDLLIVRRVGGLWDYYVSHPEITDRSFGVKAIEVEETK